MKRVLPGLDEQAVAISRFDLPVPSRFDEALNRLGIRIDMLHTEAGHA